MSSPVTPAPETVQAEAGKLIEQRTLLKGWLARLEECRTDVAEHIVERVRGDYQERLRLVAEQLGPHSEGIRRELEEMRELLGVADEAHTTAADALGEALLRQRIGEIEAVRWAEQEPELRGALDAAEAETQRVRSECERLAELLAEIEGEDSSASAVEAMEEPPEEMPPVEVEPEPLATMREIPAMEPSRAGETEEGQATDLPWLALIDSVASEDDELDGDAETDEREFQEWLAAAGDEEEEVEFGSDPEEIRLTEDAGVLEELDRAIAASAGSYPPRTPGNGRSQAAEQASRTTLVCEECGSTNDSRGWYCEICGAELS